MIAAILSDLDGVLVDSGDAVQRAWRRWAEHRGLDPAAVGALAHGRPSLDVVRLLAPELDAEPESAWVEDAQVHDVAEVRALPGAAWLLDGGPGVPVAIVTSCTLALAHARLRAAGLPVPEVLVTADRVRSGKPDPEGYLAAAAALGTSAAACLVLEDAPAGVAAGRAAGATVVALPTTHAPGELGDAHALAADVRAAVAAYSPSSRG